MPFEWKDVVTSRSLARIVFWGALQRDVIVGTCVTAQTTAGHPNMHAQLLRLFVTYSGTPQMHMVRHA